MDRNDVQNPQLLLTSLIADSDDMSIQLLVELHRKSNDTEDTILFLSSVFLHTNEEHKRIQGFCDIWLPTYLTHDFFALFRMTRDTFYTLMQKVDCPELHKVYLGGGKQVPAESQLLMTLWWLGKGETLISICDRFNVCLSTAYNCTEIILKKICCLSDECIAWPNAYEMEQVEEDFCSRVGYPGAIGAIDGCNIKFKSPADQQDSYVDRKCQHSIKLQGIVTAKKIFTNIMVGFPGSVHDSRVFQNSGLYDKVVNNNQLEQYFPNNFHLVGDSAYPLSTWVMTPYRDNGHLSAQQRHYNTCHSVTRIVVEHTFGLLKSRWRILNYINVNSVKKAVNIITACCVLHNFCYIENDFWRTYYEPLQHDDDIVAQAVDIQNNHGIQKRDEISRILFNNN